MTTTKESQAPSTTPTQKRRSRRIRRHAGTAIFAAVVFYAFWLSRAQWSPDMRFWKAAGDAGYVLLWVAIIIGPLATLWAPARKMIPWRRQLGIWFAIAASLHSLLILNGWARWSVSRFFGYEFIPQLGRDARWEPGFGLANLLGLTALFVGLMLAATSSDMAMKALGRPSWKFLHTGVYFVFYVGSLHAIYFLFIHYTVSFHKQVPEPDWFRFWFLGMVATVAVLHAAAFLKTVSTSKSKKKLTVDAP